MATTTTTTTTPNLPHPPITDRASFSKNLLALRAREKAHTREGDAIAAARRRLAMVEVPATTPLHGTSGPTTLLAAFQGRSQLLVYFHMWHAGQPAPAQCEGCTFFNGHVRELSVLHSRDVTYATFSVGPWEEIKRYREFMGLEDLVEWYHIEKEDVDKIADGSLVAYWSDGERVFQTYAASDRGCEVMANSYGLLDMTVYGRQETWEDSPEGWPRGYGTDGRQFRSGERPILQWEWVKAGRSDDLSG